MSRIYDTVGVRAIIIIIIIIIFFFWGTLFLRKLYLKNFNI